MFVCMFVHTCICLCTLGINKGEFPFFWEQQLFKVLENGESKNINNFPKQNKNALFIYECCILCRNLTCNSTASLMLAANLLVSKNKPKTKKKSNYRRRLFLGEWFLSAPSVPFPD